MSAVIVPYPLLVLITPSLALNTPRPGMLSFIPLLLFFRMLFISLYGIVNVDTPDPRYFLCIPASTDHAATINPNDIKTPSANAKPVTIIKDKPVFSNG